MLLRLFALINDVSSIMIYGYLIPEIDNIIKNIY